MREQRVSKEIVRQYADKETGEGEAGEGDYETA